MHIIQMTGGGVVGVGGVSPCYLSVMTFRLIVSLGPGFVLIPQTRLQSAPC